MKLLYTLYDIGIFQIQYRLRYEIRKLIDKILPLRLKIYLVGYRKKESIWTNNHSQFFSIGIKPPKKNKFKPKNLSFKFLNEEKFLNLPFCWNNRKWQRLWQFNLHYFDWAKQWVKEYFISGFWPKEASNLEFLIDNWIDNNSPGEGDGWHSYTLSLRIKNWILLFTFFPELINQKRIDSLWTQICWLNSHLENHHAGNHLIENLTCLIIASMNFNNPKALEIGRKSIKSLKHQLRVQILEDGGHEERSTTYHLIILERLLELCIYFDIHAIEIPFWLIDSITKMINWAELVYFEKQNYPTFNDSPIDSCMKINEILEVASSYIKYKNISIEGIYKYLIKKSNSCRSISKEFKLKKVNFEDNFDKNRNPLIDLPKTGWSILKTKYKWCVLFKCGDPCPKHLGAHAHSDQLSFDLYHTGIPLIAEVGTSTYDYGSLRKYERSGKGHNLLQLSLFDKIKNKKKWLEPVEVWSNFRVGFKCKPSWRKSGIKKDWIWARGSHNGFDRIDAKHYRWIGINNSDKLVPLLIIIDAVHNKKKIRWRINNHFGPSYEKYFKKIGLETEFFNLSGNYETCFEESYLAKGYGIREKRMSRFQKGLFNPGKHILISLIYPKNLPHKIKPNPLKGKEDFFGYLDFYDFGKVSWRWSISKESGAHPIIEINK